LVPDIKGDHRLRVFENRALRQIFRQRKDEVTGGRREEEREERRGKRRL
jgi:hypothetical protein